jgi:hypothetical protein
VVKEPQEGFETVEAPTLECPGIAGYKLHRYEFDLRANIVVVAPDGKEHNLQLPAIINPGFSFLGAKAEWRVRRTGKTIIPKALIVRYIHDSWLDDVQKVKEIHYLAVAKITSNGICVTDRIPASRTMNIKARKAANISSSKPCLSRAEDF